MAWTRTILALLSEMYTHTRFYQSSDSKLFKVMATANVLFYMYIIEPIIIT